MAEPELRGRKVFFLYPHNVIQEALVRELFRHEYEVYLLDDHHHAVLLVREYPGSILFININETLKEPEWEQYIQAVLEDNSISDARVGVCCFSASRDLAEKYLMEMMLPAGFVTLRAGNAESLKVLLTVLDANEARGKRRYVRAVCTADDRATLNLKHRNQMFTGTIHDISSAGMSCEFNEKIELDPGAVLDDMQLKLRGTLCRVKVKMLGVKHAEGEPARLVFMFDHSVDTRGREKIQRFVFEILQREIRRRVRFLGGGTAGEEQGDDEAGDRPAAGGADADAAQSGDSARAEPQGVKAVETGNVVAAADSPPGADADAAADASKADAAKG